MNKFTEGPWYIVPKDSPLTGDGVICELDRLSIRPMDGADLANEQLDAHLISAAPDLLEALEGVLELFAPGDQQLMRQLVAARNAISKAKGLRP